jgi:hypothetical protein
MMTCVDYAVSFFAVLGGLAFVLYIILANEWRIKYVSH